MANSGGGGGGGGGGVQPNTKLVFLLNSESCYYYYYYYKQIFLFVGTSLEHLSMKKFSDWTYRVCSRIREREGAWDPPPPPPPPSIPPWALSND